MTDEIEVPEIAHDTMPSIVLPDGTSLAGWSKAAAIERYGEEIINSALAGGRISKLILVDRLAAADLFDAAMNIIKQDDLTYERWQASATVDPSNVEVIALITAIGGNPDILLAVE